MLFVVLFLIWAVMALLFGGGNALLLLGTGVHALILPFILLGLIIALCSNRARP